MTNKLILKIENFNKYLLIVVAGAMVSVVIFQIIGRIGEFSVQWSEELARLLSIWATFIAVPVLIGRYNLIMVDFFVSKFPSFIQIWLYRLHLLVMLVTSLILVFYSYSQSAISSFVLSPGLQWPMYMFFLPVMYGSALAIVVLSIMIKESFEPETSISLNEHREVL
ncbi:TRAP transporter small permease [Vibrio mediterranei]|uniref:TRAP transporter small permease n=1 Tax=Vibrio mediterranei TaxID=689 RepID=UPI00148D2645|nr:TRAP transporter small permease subunit [Vibrio mediterranei]NOI23810.1 TRAP transporter small permease subunit [Vibrio mediterranei]